MIDLKIQVVDQHMTIFVFPSQTPKWALSARRANTSQLQVQMRPCSNRQRCVEKCILHSSETAGDLELKNYRFFGHKVEPGSTFFRSAK